MAMLPMTVAHATFFTPVLCLPFKHFNPSSHALIARCFPHSRPRVLPHQTQLRLQHSVIIMPNISFCYHQTTSVFKAPAWRPSWKLSILWPGAAICIQKGGDGVGHAGQEWAEKWEENREIERADQKAKGWKKERDRRNRQEEQWREKGAVEEGKVFPSNLKHY
jgi:hypothetical protein